MEWNITREDVEEGEERERVKSLEWERKSNECQENPEERRKESKVKK